MTWNIAKISTEKEWTRDYVKSVLASPCMPARVQSIGSVEVVWNELDPGVAFVHSSGGTTDDRYLAEQIVTSKLVANGYERALFSFDPEHKTSDWNDIQEKAKRLIDSGNVTILRNGYNNIVAHVIGDHGEYQCEIGRDDPESRAITTWQCDCPWDQYAWQRTRKWKKYEGRPCAHVLATFWQSQSTPLDPDAFGEAIPPGQAGPMVPGEQMALPFQQQGPVTPPGPPGAATPAPPPAPSSPGVLPPFPGEQMQMVPPGQLQPGQPGITVSQPGARQPTPFNPLQNPSTYSKAWSFESADFNNSDMVRLEEEEYGVAEGKSEAHGAGQYKAIPKGSIGEVLGQDPTTGWVDVMFVGPQANAGPMEPYHIRAWIEPSNLTPMPGIKKPGPAIRRR